MSDSSEHNIAQADTESHTTPSADDTPSMQDQTAEPPRCADVPADLKYPHVFVMGDVCQLQLFRVDDKVPDLGHEDTAPYRRIKGFVRKRLHGGAWFLARCIRAALFDVWRWRGELQYADAAPAVSIIDTRGPATSSQNEAYELAASVSVGDPSKTMPFLVDMLLESFHLTPNNAGAADFHWPNALEIVPSESSEQFWKLFRDVETAVRIIGHKIRDKRANYEYGGASLLLQASLPPISDPHFWRFKSDGGIAAYPFPRSPGTIPPLLVLPTTCLPQPLNCTTEACEPIRIGVDEMTLPKNWKAFANNSALDCWSKTDTDGNGLQINGVRYELDIGGKRIFLKQTNGFHFILNPTSKHVPSTCFSPPQAAVTTYESPDVLEQNDLRLHSLVCPIWQVGEYLHIEPRSRAESKRFRLRLPHGYEIPKPPEYIALGEIPNDDPGADNIGEEALLQTSHQHGTWTPEWIGPAILRRPYEHIAFVDLNFGFRKAPRLCRTVVNRSRTSLQVSDSNVTDWLKRLSQTEWTAFQTEFESLSSTKSSESSGTKHEQMLCPDWWCALEHWLPKSNDGAMSFQEWRAQRGWIVGIIGRSLPLKQQDDQAQAPENPKADGWESGDLWDVLRNGAVLSMDRSEPAPLFRDRTIVILNTHVLRSHEGRISHRLSWERTALDCIDCLEQHPRFQPLLEFKHVIIRVGVSGAVYLHQREDEMSGKVTHEKRLLFDAIAKDGYHRDPEQDGRVLGSNSVFAASILRSLLSSNSKPQSQGDIARAIREGITNGIDAAQEMFFHGYGDAKQWTQQAPGDVELDYRAIEQVLFSQFASLT